MCADQDSLPFEAFDSAYVVSYFCLRLFCLKTDVHDFDFLLEYQVFCDYKLIKIMPILEHIFYSTLNINQKITNVQFNLAFPMRA